MYKQISAFLLLIIVVPVVSSGQSLQLADSLRVKAEALHEQGKLREAEFYYQEAFPLYRQHQDTSSMIETGMYYAEVLYSRAKYDEAIDLFNNLLSINHTTRDSLQARMERTMGLIKENIGQLEESVVHFENALRLARETNDSLMIGYTLQSMASNYNEMGNHSKALEIFRETIPILEAVDNKGGLSTAYSNIGTIYRELLLYDEALEFFNKSLRIRETLGDIRLLATAYRDIGGLQKELGNYDQALIAYQKGLEYANKAGTPVRKAIILNNIGTLYSQIGSPARALKYYEESLAIRKDILPPSRLTTLYSNIANRRFDLGEVEQAAGYYETILSIREEQGNMREVAKTLIDLAKVEEERENWHTALDYANRAYGIADSTKDYALLGDASIWLGYINSSMGNANSAIAHFRKSLVFSRYLSKRNQIHPLTILAGALNEQNSDSALVYGREAIALIEEGRSRTGSYSSIKADYFEQYSDFYIDMASWVLKYQDDIPEAYALVEQAKARTLADELVQASQRIDEELPDSVRIERNQKLSAIDKLYSQLQAVENPEMRAQLESQIRKRELEYAAFQNELHRRYPAYKKLELQEPISLYEAQSIVDSGTAILEYAMNDERLLVFFIAEGETAVHQYRISELESEHDISINELVQEYKDAILAHAGRSELDLLSNRLYRILMEPFEEQLAQYSNILVVPDGPLAYLPFEALRHNSIYLIEQYNIKYIPSVTSLTLLKEPEREQEKQLLAVAASEMINLNNETGRQVNSLSSLPFTLVEVDSIASHFNSVTKLKEESLTEAALKQHLNEGYRFIHLATHGYIDEDHPNQSGLRLTGARDLEASAAEDGLLKSSEIYRLNLNSDMVVLSACNTGLGKVVKGEGMLGLQRSFFYAGTASVVVSLWNVYDRSTAHLMNEFYKAILSGEHSAGGSWTDRFLRWVGWENSMPFGEKASSMRAAKLSMINHPLYNHPVYWAPFIVVGR